MAVRNDRAAGARHRTGGPARVPGAALYPWLVAAVGVCLALSQLPFLSELPVYLDAARALAAGRPIADGFYPVGYPVILAPSYALLGVTGVIAFQAALYGASVWLFSVLLHRACADRLVVMAGTAALALHPYLLLNIQRINDNAINVPLVLILIALLAGYRSDGPRWVAGALGLTMGLFVAIRPNALVLAMLPLVVLAIPSRRHAGTGRAAGQVAAYLLAGVACFAGVSLLGTGAWLFFPGNGPYNLFAGTNPWSAEALRDAYNGEASVVRALAAAGVTEAPFAVPAGTYYDLVAGFLAAHPMQGLVLIGLKILNLFRPDWQFADDGLELAAQTIVATPLILWLAAWFGDAGYRASRRGRIFLAFALLFLLPFALTNSDPRFRLPLDIAFLLEAAIVFGNSTWPAWLRQRLGHSRRAYTTRS